MINFLKYLIISVLTLAFAIAAISCGSRHKSDDRSLGDSVRIDGNLGQKGKKVLKGSELKFIADTAGITDYATIITSLGKIRIGLYGKDAPNTVENFIGLAKKGYYNGVLFHRVAKNFLIQTGDGNTKSTAHKQEWGKGGKSIWGDEFDDELDPRTPSYKTGYAPGTVAMANKGPNTNTSQFFICLPEAKKLEKKWTIFGKVIEGMDVVRKIDSVDIIPGPFEQNDGMPKKPVRIYSVSIDK